MLYVINLTISQSKQNLDPQIISVLVLRLVEWYNAWAPIPECVGVPFARNFKHI